MEVTIREYASTDFSRVKELILKAENFGEPFLETELLNIKKNTSLGLGKVFVATLKRQVIGYISLGRRIFAVSCALWIALMMFAAANNYFNISQKYGNHVELILFGMPFLLILAYLFIRPRALTAKYKKSSSHTHQN